MVISEIMYHPPTTNVLEAWFEVYNPAPTNVNLTGWRVAKGVSFAFPTNAVLGAGKYLVVAAHGPTFALLHPVVTNYVAGWTGNLSRDGETIQIDDALGNTVAQVSYAAEGDWGLRRIGALDGLGLQGWEWFAEHDGAGKSVELVNAAMPAGSGQNWASSITAGGTPGRVNSAARTNIAPIIAEAQHIPAVPRSSDSVTISARILDERTNGLTVTLQWRLDGVASFAPATMFDDGAHGDGLAGDGIFGAIIPPQADKAIVEFYLTARDLENQTRTFPNVTPSGGTRTANLLYEVDNATYAGSQPVFRLIMSQAEYDYLSTQVWGGEPNSDAFVNGTFINTDGVLDNGTMTQVRYQCGFRNRGHGTRTAVPHNFHVAFPKDNLWKGRAGQSLNTHYTHSQQLGSAVFRKLGLPMADSRPVQVRVNGANLAKPGQEQFGSYAANEVVDDRLVKRQFPLDDQGNLYRGIRDMIPGISADADLLWHGAAFTGYTNAYVKENNSVANDWSDLIHLIDVLNNTPDGTYAGAVSNVVNVDEWMKYFAINTLLDNQENSLGIGAGDDYALYRGTNDTRFLVLPYDMDSLMGQGTRSTTFADGLWRAANVAAINRFIKRPEFVPAYFRHLKELSETAFNPANVNALIDQLHNDYVDATAIANMKVFNASHVAYVRALLPLTLNVQSGLAVLSGYPHTTTATVALFGGANAIDTKTIRVNGALATYSAWEGRWTNNAVTLRPGINRVLVQAFGFNGAELGRTTYDVWYDDASVASVSGAIAANTTWTAAGGPYQVTANLTVNSGVTLTIEAGTTVYLGSGVTITVASGGALLAQGTSNAPIRFTTAPSSGVSWGGMTINGAAGTPETRLIWAHIEGNSTTAIHSSAGTLFLDHLTFGTTSEQYLSLDGSSFIVSHCVFPSPTGSFEPVHGTGGVKAGGRGVFYRNFHGQPVGYNDVIDFTGGNRPGGPIVHFLDSVFMGATDDILDLDGTDAWVEGNIFLHTHKNGSPDSASAVSGGDDAGNTSQVTVINNLFYDVDQAATAKLGNYFTFINNTVVRQTKTGGLDNDAAVLNFADEGIGQAAGMYVEGNIIVDAEKLTRFLTNGSPVANATTFTNNLMQLTWAGPGGGNSASDPRLKYIPQLTETQFTTWEEAQVMRDWFSLLPGSPARGTGPNRTDEGGVRPLGASISGEPVPTNNLRTATLTVGINRSGNSIPAAGWPNGSGYTHYKYRLDGAGWSAETPIGTPISLSGLANGTHQVEVSGKRDTGLYQDDPQFGEDAVVTSSRSWVVDPAYVPPTAPKVRLNEVLAKNSTTLTNGVTTPDLIELFNYGASSVDLSGMGLTDAATNPYKFTFPSNSVLAAGAYLVLYADSGAGGPFLHTGFSLKPEGDDLSLFNKPASGGALLDSVNFGVQLADLSIGRGGDGMWTLCRPTFGTANFVQGCGSASTLKINEWLADAQFAGDNDFIELYNPDLLPVALGGLFLSDASGSPTKHPIAALSFIAGSGFTKFIADGDTGQGADHLNFKLSPDVGLILLTDTDFTTIDGVVYGSQFTDVSQGRSPSGGATITSFAEPTGGGPNPGSQGPTTVAVVTQTVRPLLNVTTSSWRYDNSGVDQGTAWRAPGFSDSAWSTGVGLFGAESTPAVYPYPFNTSVPAPNAGGHTTVYYRAHFNWAGGMTNFQLFTTNFVDDGAVYYLNGVEVARLRVAANPVLYASFASDQGSEGAAEMLSFATNNLVAEDNVLAVEVHQSNATSSDDVFGLSLSAVQLTTNFVTQLPAVTNITETIVPLLGVTTSSWRYDNSGADQGTGWRAKAFVDGAWSTGVGLFGSESTPAVYPFPFNTSVPAPNAGGHITVYYRAHFNWTGGVTNFQLIATNYVDDGAVYYLNGTEIGRLRVTANPALYTSTGSDQSSEGTPEILTFATNGLVIGDNVMAVEVHQSSATSSDDVFGMSLSAIRRSTNIVIQSFTMPVVLNEVLASNGSLTNHAGHTADYVELYNPSTNAVDLSDLSLSNDPNDPRKFVFATNTTIAALGYRIIYLDDAAPASATNAGFALAARGDALYFFHRTAGGYSLLDAVRFGLQTPDFALGRVPNGTGNWSLNTLTPGAANTAAALASISALRVNEWMADPSSGGDWFEVYNSAAQPVALGGLYLTDDLANKFQSKVAPLSFLGAGANGFLQFIADGLPGSGADHVNFALKKGGEALGIYSPSGAQLDAIAFGAQTTGVSQGRFPDGAAAFVSFATTASPEESNYLPLTNAVVNEVLTHTDLPLEDAVEFFNPSGADASIGGWYLSNSKDNLKKFRIDDGTTLTAGGYRVFYETQFNSGSSAFTFNAAHGDSAILSAADALGNLTGYRAEVKFGATENGVSFGRYPTSVGVDFTAMSTRTFGAPDPTTVAEFRLGTGLPNSGAKVGPIVISEVMYYSLAAGLENSDDEFIELENITSSPVPLFDPSYPTNHWRLRDAVNFEFPAGVTLAANSRLLVVNFTPTDAYTLAAFRAKFNVPAGVPIYGPWTGRLANDSDSVELAKPDAVQLAPHLDAGFVPQILVDKVRYSAAAPWPAGAAVGTNSLQRRVSSNYGNDPVNWLSAAPTAGRSSSGGAADSDGDGMDDSWELANFGTLSRDGTVDFDSDGVSDLNEFLAGTNPTDSASYLRLDVNAHTSTTCLLGFRAVAGKTYTVQYRDLVDNGPWQKLADIPAQLASGPYSVTDTTVESSATRFYRVVTPAQ